MNRRQLLRNAIIGIAISLVPEILRPQDFEGEVFEEQPNYFASDVMKCDNCGEIVPRGLISVVDHSFKCKANTKEIINGYEFRYGRSASFSSVSNSQ